MELDKNVIECYKNIIDLFALDQTTTDLLKKCVCNPLDFYNQNIAKYEERNIEEDDGEQELIWIGIVDTLIEKEMLFEFDWKVDLDTFLYGMKILCAGTGLTINEELLDENKDIREWSRILTDKFKEKGYVVAAMDIDSDSYCTIVVPVDKFEKLVSEAEKAGHRIDLAQNM